MDSKASNHRIALTEEDVKALRDVGENVMSGLKSMQSFRTRVGSGVVRKISVIIVQDPDNPDLVQLCTDVVSGNPDGSFNVSCWCNPPGTCTPGPCGLVRV